MFKLAAASVDSDELKRLPSLASTMTRWIGANPADPAKYSTEVPVILDSLKP